MDVTITLPTYGDRNCIFSLLSSLKQQSYKNFNILVIYKLDRAKKSVIDRIKEYRSLNIELVAQTKGMAADVINIAYAKADGDIIINTDDDAQVSRNFVKNHVELHNKHPEVGVATGLVDDRAKDASVSWMTDMLHRQMWRMNKHTIIDRPIGENFKEYGMYPGKSGMLVDTGKRYNMINTLKQHGVNMSWKKDALHGFKLPGYTKRAIGNEQAASLEAIKRGYTTVWFDGALVYHPWQESNSRSLSVKNVSPTLTAESVLFSYYIDRFTDYKIDLGTLKRRVNIDMLMSMVISPSASIGYRIGYNLAEGAIVEQWRPNRVRKELLEALDRVAK